MSLFQCAAGGALRDAGNICACRIVLDYDEFEHARFARDRLPKIKIGGKLVEVANPVGEEPIEWPRRHDEDAARQGVDARIGRLGAVTTQPITQEVTTAAG